MNPEDFSKTGGKPGARYLSTHNFYVHRLVAEAFIPNPENKEEVNHIDGKKMNNHVENLEWVTSSENNYHAYEIGLMKKLSEKEIEYRKNEKELKSFNRQWLTLHEINFMYIDVYYTTFIQY